MSVVRHSTPWHHWRAGRFDPSRRWVAMLVILATACGGAPGVDRSGTTSDALPRLEERPVPVADLSPGSVEAAVVAGPDGGWLFAPADLRASALVLVEPDGRSSRPLGAYGEGPGEMRASFPLWLDDTIAIGHDLATRRVIIWNRDGSVRRTFRPVEPVVPFARGPGSTLLASRFRERGEVPVLVALVTGEVEEVVPPSDSILATLFRDDATISDRVANTPAIGRWRDGVVVANGLSYVMGLWRGDGTLAGTLSRDLPPVRRGAAAVERELRSLGVGPVGRNPERLAELRRRLEEAPIRRFDHVGAPRTDGHGRLWVVVQEGDSVAADVFSAERFLGRLPLDCPGYGGRWDLNGEWLLLVCEPDDPASDLDAVLRRYRIVEP